MSGLSSWPYARCPSSQHVTLCRPVANLLVCCRSLHDLTAAIADPCFLLGTTAGCMARHHVTEQCSLAHTGLMHKLAIWGWLPPCRTQTQPQSHTPASSVYLSAWLGGWRHLQE